MTRIQIFVIKFDNFSIVQYIKLIKNNVRKNEISKIDKLFMEILQIRNRDTVNFPCFQIKLNSKFACT